MSARFVAAMLSLVLSLPACIVMDTRELEIEPSGTLHAETRLRMQVNGPFEHVTIEIDGRPLEGTFRANEPLVIWHNVPNGTHRLTVRAHDGSAPRSTERTLIVDTRWLEIESVTPAPGVITTGEPLSLAVRFSKPLSSASVTPGRVRVMNAGGPVPVSPVLDGDGRTVRVALPAALDVLGVIRLYLDVDAAGGSSIMGELGPWSARVARVTVTSPARELVTNASHVSFAATVEGDIPPTVDLFAGDHFITTLGAPPWNAVWAAVGVPDGTYPLSFRTPRGYFIDGAMPSITLDRTAPTITSCAPAQSAPDDASAGECVHLAFTEPLFGDLRTADLRWSGGGRAPTVERSAPYASVTLCPTTTIDPGALPVVQSVVLPPVRDRAGNLLAPFTCDISIPAWRQPWGSGPVSGLVSSASGVGVGVGHPYPPGQLGERAEILVASASGEAEFWESTLPAAFSRAEVLDRVPAAPVVEIDGLAWIERGAGGAGLVFARGEPSAPLNGDTQLDARSVTAGVHLPWQVGPTGVAWSEAVPSGGRQVRVKLRQDGTWVSTGHPPSSPGAVADEPALCTTYPGLGSFFGPFLVWTETENGGSTRLRGAVASSLRSPTSIEWSSLESIANGDAAVAAAEPSAFAYGSTGAVAWREHDRILARASSYTEFGAAIALNVDPARAARRPRFDGYVSDATVYWIEQGAAGDEIWGRRWDGSEWRLLPGPVNAGAEGGVRTFDVINGAVVWVDDVGATRIRVAAF